MSIFTRSPNSSKFTAVVSPMMNGARFKSKDSPFTSGLGTIIEKEHELLRLIQESIYSAAGPYAFGIKRILGFHGRQTEGSIALLEFYSELLPVPRRFAVLKSGPPMHLRAAGPVGRLTPLKKLALLHGRLFRDLETLRKTYHHKVKEPQVFSVVAQRHEDMAWMLTALSCEDERAFDPGLTPIVAFEPSLAEQKWETDGGARRF